MNLGDNSFLEFAEKHTIFFCCHLERSERSQATERYSKRCLALLNMTKCEPFHFNHSFNHDTINYDRHHALSRHFHHHSIGKFDRQNENLHK